MNNLNSSATFSEDDVSHDPCGGIGRMYCLLAFAGIGMAYWLVDRYTHVLSSHYVLMHLILLGIIAIPLAFRLQNLGFPRYLCCLIAIPAFSPVAELNVVPLAVAFMCLTFPEGYRHHRQMDVAGNFVGALVLISIVCIPIYGIHAFNSFW